MTDKDLIAKVVSFAETAITEFVSNNDYAADVIAFNMDAAKNCVYISLTSKENNEEVKEKYDETAYLSENLTRIRKGHTSYNISKLPFHLEELWEKPNIASIALLPEEQLAEFTGAKRIKKFYTICTNGMIDFMRTDTFSKLLRKDRERFYFNVINRGDSLDLATEYMRTINKSRK